MSGGNMKPRPPENEQEFWALLVCPYCGVPFTERPAWVRCPLKYCPRCRVGWELLDVGTLRESPQGEFLL